MRKEAMGMFIGDLKNILYSRCNSRHWRIQGVCPENASAYRVCLYMSCFKFWQIYKARIPPHGFAASSTEDPGSATARKSGLQCHLFTSLTETNRCAPEDFCRLLRTPPLWQPTVPSRFSWSTWWLQPWTNSLACQGSPFRLKQGEYAWLLLILC